MRRFENTPCILCKTNLVVGKGEHVLPYWYNKWCRKTCGIRGHGVQTNGKPHLNRHGNEWKQDSPHTAMAPVCQECNDDHLNKRFETPYENLIKQVLAGELRLLKQDDWEKVGLWLLKTSLLYVHPETQHSMDTRNKLDGWAWDLDPVDLYSWLCDSRKAPPDFLSVWIAVETDNHNYESVNSDTMKRVGFNIGSSSYKTQSANFGLHDLRVQMIHHPGRRLSHPLESAGLALRVFPKSLGCQAAGFHKQTERELWPSRVSAFPKSLALDGTRNPMNEPFELSENGGLNPTHGVSVIDEM